MSSLKEQKIKEMVSRFIGWKLPDDFSPDGGISFKREFNEHTDHPAKHEPVGTNLFTATQAEEMIKYILGDSFSTLIDEVRREIEERVEKGIIMASLNPAQTLIIRNHIKTNE